MTIIKIDTDPYHVHIDWSRANIHTLKNIIDEQVGIINQQSDTIHNVSDMANCMGARIRQIRAIVSQPTKDAAAMLRQVRQLVEGN